MKSIIVVEDFDFIRLDFIKKVANAFKIYEASETNEARELISQHKIDTIIIDSKLKYTNPYDFIDEIKLTHPEIKLIAFLNKSNIEMLQLFIHHGVSEYIFKTDSAHDLINKLK